MLTEEQLIELIPSLKKYSKKLTKDYEDLLQETLLKVWLKRELYDPTRGPLKVWALSIMHNIHVSSLYSGGSGGGRKKVLKAPYINIDSIKYERKIYPNQEHRISFKEAQRLPNFDLSLASALGYSLEEIMKQLDSGQGVVISRTSAYENIQKFRMHKEEFV